MTVSEAIAASGIDAREARLLLAEVCGFSQASLAASPEQEIPFEVLEDVSVDHVIVLPKGATAIATVTETENKKSMGRAGKLNIAISYARLKDQEKLALRATQENKGGGHVGAMTGACGR